MGRILRITSRMTPLVRVKKSVAMVYLGFRKFVNGTVTVWYAYIQIGPSWLTGLTIGWAGGQPYSESEQKLTGKREVVKQSRKKSGSLPSGTPCKCATPRQIHKCLKNSKNYPIGTYDAILRNCGDWASIVLEKCCIEADFPYWVN